MIAPVPALEQMTDEQLDDILEKADMVHAKEGALGAVGPLLSLKVKIEGEVDAVVDTGSQSTVISRSMLHKIGKHLKSQSKDYPKLDRPHLVCMERWE